MLPAHPLSAGTMLQSWVWNLPLSELPAPKPPRRSPWPARQLTPTASATSLFQDCKTCSRKGLCTKGFSPRSRNTAHMNTTFMACLVMILPFCLFSVLAYDWGVLVLPQNTNIPIIALREGEYSRCKAEKDMKAKQKLEGRIYLRRKWVNGCS